MAREKDKQLAHYYYVEKQKTAKETAALAGTTERTMSLWVNKYGWKTEREARALSASARLDNIQHLISDLARQRIDLGKELEEAVHDKDEKKVTELRRSMAAVDDGAAKWNKALENARKQTQPSLTVYLEIMERIFNALREFDSSLYLKTVDFQEQHVLDVSEKIDRL